MILLEPDKARARIHMRVPVLGVQDSGFSLGYRFANVMGQFERRMNMLQPHEYARLTGTPTSAVGVIGVPGAGATIVLTVGALAPFTYTVTSQDAANSDPTLAALTNAANAWNAANASQYIVTQQPSVVFPVQQIGAGPREWQLAFVSTAATAFTVTVTTTGNWSAYVALQGKLPNPSVTFQDDSVTAVGYLNICDYLEGKIAQASDLMKYSTADVVTFRRDETQARKALYNLWCQRLADFFGIPLYPMPGVGRFGGSNTGLVV